MYEPEDRERRARINMNCDGGKNYQGFLYIGH